MLGLWLFWPSLGCLLAASPNGRWGLIARAGDIHVLLAPEPSLVVLVAPSGDAPYLFDTPYAWRLATRGTLNPGIKTTGLGVSRTASLNGNLMPLERWIPKRIDGTYSSGVSIPTWCLAMVPAAIFGLTESRHRRRTRLERIGRCPHGNYNRAGLAMNAPVPECGKRIEDKVI